MGCRLRNPVFEKGLFSPPLQHTSKGSSSVSPRGVVTFGLGVSRLGQIWLGSVLPCTTPGGPMDTKARTA